MSTEQTLIANTIGAIAQTCKYLLTLKDWHNLTFISRDVMLAVKRYLQFGFTLDDQWVFQNVRDYGEHALYHANNPCRIELTFREVGYCLDANICGSYRCKYQHTRDFILQTPISHAIVCNLSDYLKMISKKGLSKTDFNAWELIGSAIRSFNPIMIEFVRSSFPRGDPEFKVSDYDILSMASIMPDNIVERCIDFVISTGIDVNEKDEYGCTILFITTHSKRALECLKRNGINISSRDSNNNNIVDFSINFVNNHMMNVINPNTLRSSREELAALSEFNEFAGDRENISITILRINSILALMGEAV